jgi:uncharacterized membrane protein YfcA
VRTAGRATPDVLVREDVAGSRAVGVASALILTIAAPVPWISVAVLAGGLLVGSLVGPLLARRLPAGILRWAVAILGFTLAVIFFVDTL